jgi:hypothetical protein
MNIKININCNNDAFQDDLIAEVRSVLDKLLIKLEQSNLTELGMAWTTDSNGNKCAYLEID